MEGLVKYNIIGAIKKENDGFVVLVNSQDENFIKLDNGKIANSDALFIVEQDENSLEISNYFRTFDKPIIELEKQINNQIGNVFTVFIDDTYYAYHIANQLTKLGYRVNVFSDSMINQLIEMYSNPNINIINGSAETNMVPENQPYVVIEGNRSIIAETISYRLNNDIVESKIVPIQLHETDTYIINYIKCYFWMCTDILGVITEDISNFRKDESSQYNLFRVADSFFLFEANTRASYTLSEDVYKFLDIYFNGCGEDIERYITLQVGKNENKESLVRAYENFSRIRYISKLYAKKLEYKLLYQEDWYSGECIISFIGKKTCNLSCKYCFMDKKQEDNLNREELSEEVIRAGLDFILQRKENTYRVRADYSLGGEPLLSFDTYKKLWSIVKEYDQREEGEVALGFITNATLLNGEIIDWFNQNHHWIGFSLDGGKSTNDSMRIYPNGNGSFEKAYSNISKVLELNWEHFPGVNAVLTAENPDVLGVFMELWNLGFRIITIKLVRADSTKSFAITMKNINIIKENYFKFAEYLIQHCKRGNYEYLKAILVPFDFFGRFLMRVFMRDRAIIKRCPGGERIFSVRNNGDIYPCDSFNGMDAFKMGNLKDKTFDKSVFVPEKVTEAERCKNCWARYLCGGVCSYTAYINSGLEESASDAECELEKYLIMLSCYLWSELKRNVSEDDINSLRDYIKLMTGGKTW